MHQITVQRSTPHTTDALWRLLADFGAVHRYSAGVESSPINPGTPATGVGAERHCHLYDGNHIQERITEFVDGEVLALEVFDTSMPLKRANARFVILPQSNGGSTITMTMNYEVKWGLMGSLMNALMLRKALAASFANLLAGLDEHAATGTPIARGWKPAKAA